VLTDATLEQSATRVGADDHVVVQVHAASLGQLEVRVLATGVGCGQRDDSRILWTTSAKAGVTVG